MSNEGLIRKIRWTVNGLKENWLSYTRRLTIDITHMKVKLKENIHSHTQVFIAGHIWYWILTQKVKWNWGPITLLVEIETNAFIDKKINPQYLVRACKRLILICKGPEYESDLDLSSSKHLDNFRSSTNKKSNWDQRKQNW